MDQARHKFLPKCIGSEEKMKVIFDSHAEGRRKLSSTSDVHIEKKTDDRGTNDQITTTFNSFRPTRPNG
jgi:hypothetical protein